MIKVFIQNIYIKPFNFKGDLKDSKSQRIEDYKIEESTVLGKVYKAEIPINLNITHKDTLSIINFIYEENKLDKVKSIEAIIVPKTDNPKSNKGAISVTYFCYDKEEVRKKLRKKILDYKNQKTS